MNVHKRIEYVFIVLKMQGFLMKDICFKTNKTSGTLRNYRVGERKPDFEFLLSLKDMLPPLDLNWLVTGVGTPFLDGSGSDWQDQLTGDIEDLAEKELVEFPVSNARNNPKKAMAMLMEVEESLTKQIEEIKSMLAQQTGKLKGVISASSRAMLHSNC